MEVRGRVLPLRGSLLLVGVVAVVGWAWPAVAADPWGWPLAGPQAVSRPFDPPETRYGAGHRGADLAGRDGVAVRAAGAGRVSYAGLLAGRGVVVVTHGELRTTYEPVTAVVRVGQRVAAGQVLGRLTAGHAGCPSACLHWGLLRGDTYLDPVLLVRSGPPRLLPLDRAAAGGRAAAPPPVPRAAARRSDPPAAAVGRPAREPALLLRSADVAWGTLAVTLLVAGLTLLLRPARRPPDGPASPAMHAAVPTGQIASVRSPAGRLVDLAAERNRRRSDVA